MKSDTQILNELAAKSKYLHVLTEKESDSLKQMLLIMYKDIAKVCDENGITFMLGGGSCLGAIRHQGYIPWDDDLDLMMMRKDYELLINLCRKGALGDKYEIDTPSKDKDCKNLYLKIYRKGTLNNELLNENTPFPKGIFIDIFPMDSASSNKIAQKVHGFISDVLQFISTCVLYSEYPSSRYLEFVSGSEEALKRYKQRIAIGKLFGLISHKTWAYWFDKYNSSSRNTGYTTVPTGRKHYVGEIQPTKTFLPVKYASFEGMQCPIPADADAYLTALYLDYMQLPPENKRERHFVYQFECILPK